MNQFVLIAILSAGVCLSVSSVRGQSSTPTYTGQWVSISDNILAELGKTHAESDDTFARMTAGITVDRTNGDVYLMANNIGICKSVDQGKKFTLVSGDTVTGRFETACGLNMDPSGQRLMCFTIYGASAYTPDGGRTWLRSKLGHMDYGAVDWADTGKTLLSIGHESGGKLQYSSDAGETWKSAGLGYWGVGLFDHSTLVATRADTDGIVRCTDGQTWTKVSDEKVAAPVMVFFKGVGYWLGDNGLLVSKDKGLTWKSAGALPRGASIGPMFGTDEHHMVVGSPDGLFESKDAGKTWALAVPLAPDINIQAGGKWANYAWDPIHNIFYASQMTKSAYQFVAK